MVQPTKKSISVPGDHHVNVVKQHRLADGHHSTVFPQHVGENHWHGGHRNGHMGSHTSPARKTGK